MCVCELVVGSCNGNYENILYIHIQFLNILLEIKIHRGNNAPKYEAKIK